MKSKILNILFWSIISAAFIGPGTVTTASMAGLRFDHSLVWALVFSVLACIILQEASARIAIISRRGLGQIIANQFATQGSRSASRYIIAFSIFIGCGAYQGGNLLGALSGAQLIFQTPNIWLSTLLFTSGVVLLYLGKTAHVARFLGMMVATMGVAFVILAWQVPTNSNELIRGFVPKISQGSELLVIALIGTTIVPYNIFLGAGIGINQSIKEMRFGLSIAILLGGLVTYAILHVGTGIEGEFSFQKLVNAFEPYLGQHSGLLIGFGLIAAGFTSSVTAPLAAAITFQGCFSHKSFFNGSSSTGFRMVWFLTMLIGFAFTLMDIKPVPAILLAQAINGVILPGVTIYLWFLVNSDQIAVAHRNNIFQNTLMIVVVFVTIFFGLLNISRVAIDILPFNIVSNSQLINYLLILDLLILGILSFKMIRRPQTS